MHYDYGKYCYADNLRYVMRKDKCVSSDGAVKPGWNIDLSQYPQHILRVNYSVAIWKRTNVPQPGVVSSADGMGWKPGGHGKLESILVSSIYIYIYIYINIYIRIVSILMMIRNLF